MTHGVNVCNKSLKSSFLISGFPTLILLVQTLSINFSFQCVRKIIWGCLAQKWGKKIAPLARNPGLCFHSQSFAELWVAGCPLSADSCGCECCPLIGRLPALLLVDSNCCSTACNWSFTSQIPPSGFGSVFAALLRVVCFLFFSYCSRSNDNGFWIFCIHD